MSDTQDLGLTWEASAEVVPGTPDSRRLARIRALCDETLALADCTPTEYVLANNVLAVLDAPEESP